MSRFELSAFLFKNIRRVILLSFIVLLVVVFSLSSEHFFQLFIFMNLIQTVAVLSIVSIGMTLVILAGEFDLSVGSALALAAVSAATVLESTNSVLLAFLVVFAITGVIGFINGYFIGVLRINSIIITLAMLGMARSLALVITEGNTIRVASDIYNWLGGAYIQNTVPVALFVIIILYMLFHVLLHHSIFGRRIQAIGVNRGAARYAGVRVERNVVGIFVITGLLVGLASIVFVGRANSAPPLSGIGLEFEAITAVILGGASLKGGRADFLATIMGVLILGLIGSGLTLLRVDVFYINIIKGLVLFFAVILNTITEKYEYR